MTDLTPDEHRAVAEMLTDPAEEWEAPALHEARRICGDTRRRYNLPLLAADVDCRECPCAADCELG